MTDCFNSLVGITRDTCNCEGTEYGYQWHYEQFTGSFVATYKLPTVDKIQLFEDGVLVDGSRLAVDNKNLDITDQTDGLYQIWYYAYVPLSVTLPDYNVSKSGLFLTDLLPISTLQGLKTCNETMWQVLRNTKSLALKETVQSLNAIMNRKNSKKYKEYQGFIGGDGDTYLTSTKTYAGLRIRTNPIRSGYLRINAIAPGLTDTPLAAKILSRPESRQASEAQHPLGRVGTAEEVASLACWLLSPQANWVTGQVYGIDGGLGTVKAGR